MSNFIDITSWLFGLFTADKITALSSIVMVIIAGLALRTWRKEFIGKRKIEMAADIMASVYAFQDLLMHSRINIETPQENSEIGKWLEEVNSKKQNIPDSILWPIYPDRFHCLAPIHRLNKGKDIADKFEGGFNLALIYWEEDLYKLLVELHSFLGKIRYASEMLYEHPNNKEFWDTVFVNMPPTDQISKRITEIGDEIKQNLEPLYKDKQTPWKKLKNI